MQVPGGAVVRQAFSYAFAPESADVPVGYVPRLEFRRIDARPFEACGERVTPIPLKHSRFNVLGFRFADVAYCTDVSSIPDFSE